MSYIYLPVLVLELIPSRSRTPVGHAHLSVTHTTGTSTTSTTAPTSYTMSIQTVVENPITPDQFYQGKSLTFEVHFRDKMVPFCMWGQENEDGLFNIRVKGPANNVACLDIKENVSPTVALQMAGEFASEVIPMMLTQPQLVETLVDHHVESQS